MILNKSISIKSQSVIGDLIEVINYFPLERDEIKNKFFHLMDAENELETHLSTSTTSIAKHKAKQ